MRADDILYEPINKAPKKNLEACTHGHDFDVRTYSCRKCGLDGTDYLMHPTPCPKKDGGYI